MNIFFFVKCYIDFLLKKNYSFFEKSFFLPHNFPKKVCCKLHSCSLYWRLSVFHYILMLFDEFLCNSISCFCCFLFSKIAFRSAHRNAGRFGQLQHHRQGAQIAVWRHEGRQLQMASTLGQIAERAASDASSQRAGCLLQLSGT